MSLLILFNQRETETTIFALVTGSLQQNEVSGSFISVAPGGTLSKKDFDGQMIENISGTINTRELAGTLNFKT